MLLHIINMNDYYENYELNDSVYNWMLSDNDKLVLDSAIWLVDNKSSIRKTAKEFCVSKSRLHNMLAKYLRDLSYELFLCVKRQLSESKEKFRGNLVF